MKYDQLVVCEGLDFKEENKKEFYQLFKKQGFSKPKIVGVVETLPSKDASGSVIVGTGGRKDFFFYINNKDINKFAVWRIAYSMRWIEDLYYSGEINNYPEEFKIKYPKRW